MTGQRLPAHYFNKFGLAFLAISALFLSLSAGQIYASYFNARNHATTNASNLALILESKLATDFEAAHGAISAMAAEISPHRMRQPLTSTDPQHVTEALKARVRTIRSVSGLRYFDAGGNLLYSSVDSEPSLNVADRAFFRQARDDKDPAHPVIFSEVVLGRYNNRASVIVAKAIVDEDETFLGVATTSIDLYLLHEHFGHIDLGADGTVVLRRLESGALVVNYPGAVGVNNVPYPDIPLRRAILQDGPKGAIEFDSPIDGVRRIYGYRKVGSFPFFVAVGIAERAYLAEWRRNLVTTLLASTLFLAMLAAVFARLARAESQRDRTALAHRRNEERLGSIFRAIPHGLIFHDKNGVIVDANPAAEQLMGVDRAQLVGKTCTDPSWQAIREDHTAFHDHQHPAMVALRTGQSVPNEVLGLVAAGRGFRWMSINANPIFGKDQQLPDSVVTTFSDITERKHAETELRIAATAFQSKEGMMVTDNNGVILRINRMFTEITGYSAGEVLGRTPRMLQSGLHDTYFYRRMWKAILGTGGWQGEIWDRRKDGELCPMWLTISAVKDESGNVTHYVGTHSDITERKNAEMAMLNLNRDLSESRQRVRALAAQNEARLEGERKHIAQEVHDELGQVLTALRMDLSLLAMRFGALDPSLNDKVLDMKRLVDRAILGVRNVAVNLRPPALDMGLVPAVAWLCSDFTRQTGIDCLLDAGNENIELDEMRAVVIFRIVQESLTNVMRYAGASKVEISLACSASMLSLEVRDDGCGFDQGAAAQRKTFGLLGMRERALALGGRVDIVSAPGTGTVIGVAIPVAVDEREECV
ncbi:MAG: PAS domain S-box protein [Telluria sp.]